MRTGRIIVAGLALVTAITGGTFVAARSTGSIAYEAEAAELAGGARVAACDRCSGGSRVTALGEVTFTGVLSDQDGPAKVQIAYSALADRPVRVSANGGPATDLVLSSTRGADRVSTARVTLTLRAGENQIAVTAPAGPGPDIDKIVLNTGTHPPAVVATISAIPPVTLTKPPAEKSADKRETELIALVNAERAKAGCDPVTADPKLATAARAHSADMAAHGYSGSTGPDGKDFATRVSDAGFRWTAVAENVAKGARTPKAAMAIWTASAPHRANIVNCTYLSIGVGVAADKSGVLLWTQDFARAK